MPRTVTTGRTVVVTKLRDYRWQVRLDAAGEPELVEEYVCTDEEWGFAETRKFNPIPLTAAERTALRTALRKYLNLAATRESVEVESA